jgi:DNA-binding NarL/FixJ family response regulator
MRLPRKVPSRSSSKAPSSVCPSVAPSGEIIRPHPSLPGRRFRVAVVDDELDVHQSVQFVLEGADEFEPAGFYLCGRDALTGLFTEPPDVVLMDIRLPDISGIECTRRLTAGLPDLRVVMISALDDRRTMEDAIKAGCHGYLTKPFGSRQFFAVLRCALATRFRVAHPSTPSDEPCALRQTTNGRQCFQFTLRDVKVLGALMDGKLYKQIGADLNLKRGLTHKLINRVFRRLRVHSRQELVPRWLQCSRCSHWGLRRTRLPESPGSGPDPGNRPGQNTGPGGAGL